MNTRSFLLGLTASSLLLAASFANAAPKYVFFFLGDGMSSAQIQATEAYLTTLHGGSARVATDLLDPNNRLNMTQMAVQGMQTTYDSYALMTDSASSATAFSSGIKTKSGTINMDPDLSYSVKSIAELAHERGRKVGIISSVPLNHATPAAYYASVPHRGLYNNIATQMVESNYEFFGGGGLLSPTGPARDGDTSNNIWDLLTANGYTLLNDRDSILALSSQPRSKVVAINPTLAASEAMPYAVDRPDENLSLAEMTQVAIDNLYALGQDSGFFLMVEGGKIDWACHANDAIAAIGDVMDFDQAVGRALEFMRAHPNDTLVVVTGDHETGGMTIGHALTRYTAYYERLLPQTHSYEFIQETHFAPWQEAYRASYDWTQPNNLEQTPDVLAAMENLYGLRWEELNDFQKKRLEDAYDKSMSGENGNSADENQMLYGPYEPFIVTLSHIVNERASIGWTSYSHTGVPVPLFAEGESASVLAGFYDNTDIAKRLAQIMELPSLPVVE